LASKCHDHPAVPEQFNRAVSLKPMSSDDSRWSCPLYSSYSPSAPAASVTAANQPEQQQKDNGPDEGVYDQSNNPDSEVNTKPRQEPIANKGADQTDYQITDQSKTATLHHPACQPSGNNSDNNYNKKTLIGQVHDIVSPGGIPVNAGWR
jgi:hypothetical protein